MRRNSLSGKTGRGAFVMAAWLAVGSCGSGLRVGIMGVGEDGRSLEINGINPAPVEIMTGASERLTGISVRNPGATAVHDVQVFLNAGATPFRISADGCSGPSLDAGESCALELTVVSPTSGNLMESIHVTSTEAEASAVVSTVAAGLVASVVVPGSLAAAVGCSSAETTVEVTNQGHLTSTLSLPVLSAMLRDNQQGTCVSGAGTGLAPGKSCLVYVHGFPGAVGVSTESFAIAGMPGGRAQVSLETLGLADYIVEPVALTLTSVNGAAATSAVVISMGLSGHPAIAFNWSTDSSPAFTILSRDCLSPVPACGSCSVSLGFTPPNQGTYNATLLIYANGTSTPVQLTGVW
jgi:hypothetical protein